MVEQPIKKEEIPETIYHIVPIKIFKKYSDKKGTYDPRNKIDFVKNSPFIHTTPTIEQIKKYLTYFQEIPDKRFYLLKINTEKLNIEKMTYLKTNNLIFHHIWEPLKKEQYTKKIVRKTDF